MEHGPLTAVEITRHLYPGGMTTGRKGKAGDPVRVRADRIRRDRLEPLVAQKRLTLSGSRYRVGGELGTVMVLYLGTLTVHACIYDAAGIRVAHQSHDRLRPVREETDLKGLLRAAVKQLAELWRRPQGASPLAPPRAMAVALPAALDPTGVKVVSADPPGWTRFRNLRGDIEDLWRAEQRAPEVPDLPRLPDGRLALTLDTDVVADTIAAMYDRPVSTKPNDPSTASVVLGVKCSGGVRSTLITRGPRDLFAGAERVPQPRRQPGVARDAVYRGAYGDTAGLGHSIALVHRSRVLDVDVEGWSDVESYWKSLDAPSCSCKSTAVPHLQQLVSLPAVAKRLDIAGAMDHPMDADEFRRRWVMLGGPQDEDQRHEHVLVETGRLLGYALDTGIRLYDPQAVFVTGTVVKNDVVWRSVVETSDASYESRLSLVRAVDLPSDDSKNPIGPRGAARLALDTWLYPELLSGNWLPQASPRPAR